jgi:hypothetical protein
VSEIRVLSLLQPWASLWVSGDKMIETRSWGTDYRGLVAVHASKGFRVDERHLCTLEPFVSALTKLGFRKLVDIPRGCLIGVVELTGCLRMTDRPLFPVASEISLGDDQRLTDNEREFGHYAPGRFAWTTGPRRWRFKTPIPMRGALGLRRLAGDEHRAAIVEIAEERAA